MQKQIYERFENMIKVTKHAGNRWRPQKCNVETKTQKTQSKEQKLTR